MTSSSERMEVGVAHRALEGVTLHVHFFDALSVEERPLRRGEIFIPWQPLPQWRGEKLPVTLGADATAFEWSAVSPAGHFMLWDDFVERCAPLHTTNVKAKTRVHERPLASPFADLAAIGARLRARAKDGAELAAIDALLARIAELHVEHASAAEAERSALGFDNTDSARAYADEQDRALAEARHLLQQARDIALA